MDGLVETVLYIIGESVSTNNKLIVTFI